ncbi:MAG: hypothetical protein M9936_15190 [Caldilinea sp.]|nr:hypothetical protein [Caldilinea sp.]
MTRRDWWIVLGITLLAGALRFYQLGVVPPGPQFDEAFNAIDAGQVLAGNRPLFLPANGGREVLYTYYQAAIGALTGRLDLYTLRLASALAGTLTVPAVYMLVRALFRRHSQVLAALTALALTVSYWHIHFSHYGIRIILMPLILSGVFGLFWYGCAGGNSLDAEAQRRRGKEEEERGREGEGESGREGARRAEDFSSPLPTRPSPLHWLAFVGSGVLAGLGVWNNPTGRFVPFVLLAYVLWLLWRHPGRRRLNAGNPLAGLVVAGLAAFVVFLPLGLEFLRHPEFFFGHASEVSVFAERVSGEASPWQLLAINILRVLGMFSFDGDLEWAHGIPDRPVFDWFMAIPFYIGVALWTWRLLGKARPQPDPDRDALFLFAAWAFVMLAPSVLSEAAPNYSRTLAAVPPVMLGAGLGLTWIATWPRLGQRLRAALVAVLLLLSGASTFYDYFVRYPAMPEVYYAYDADKVDAIDWMKARGDDGNTIFLSPLWSTHATVTFLRDHRIRSLDPAQAMVLPEPGKGAIYAFPSEQLGEAERVAALWNEPVQILDDRLGNPLLAYVMVDSDTAQEWPPGIAIQQPASATFDDAPALRGMSVADDGRSITLFWEAEASTRRDLTSFVHLQNARNQRVGQADVIPGDGTYPTTVWRAGERVAQHYSPAIDDVCSGGETVRVLAGWYEYAADGARRPRLDAPGDSALAGTWTLPIVSLPFADAQPAARTTLPLGQDGLVLTGYSLPASPSEAGAPLTLELYFQGGPEHADLPAALTLKNGSETTLWSGALAADADWRDGEIVCRRLHLRMPQDLEPGDYTLALEVGGYGQMVAPLTIQPSTRVFDVPAVQRAVDATLGDAIRLHGADVTPGDDTLTVRLLWQSLAPLATSEKVFVHLVGPDGTLVAQSDAVPAQGYGTEQWIEGEVVADEHVLVLPADLAPGAYRLRAGMYDPATAARLPASDAEGRPYPDDAIDLGDVTLGN